MLKWIGRIFYVIIIVFIAIIVYREADNERRLTYLEDNSIEYYKADDIENYINEYMIATSRDKYIKKALYQGVSTEPGKTFTLSAFHNMSISNRDEIQVLTFVLHNLDLDFKPINEENYLVNNNLLAVRLGLNFADSQILQEFNFDGEILAGGTNYALGLHLPLEVIIGVNDSGRPYYQVGNNIHYELEMITLEIVDYTENLNDPTVTYLASFSNNESLDNNFQVEDELVLGSGLFRDYTKDVITDFYTDSLVSTKFITRAANYNLSEMYQSGSRVTLVNIDGDKLSEYNSIIFRWMVSYSLIVIVITYLLFFLKPTINYFKNRKIQKISEANEGKIEPIFKEHE